MWRSPPRTLCLNQAEAHLWRANLDQDPANLEILARTLSLEEQEKAEKFYFPKHGKRYTAARGFLRHILAKYLNIKPQEVAFSYGERGKPYLAKIITHNNLEFNLSHSEDVAVYGVTRNYAIGIDVENLRAMENLEQLVNRFYCPEEAEFIRQLAPEHKIKAFFRAWTAKEAYLKATGEGLAGGLDRVSVSLEPNQPLCLFETQENSPDLTGWSFLALDVHPNFSATVAIAAKSCQLSYWQATL